MVDDVVTFLCSLFASLPHEVQVGIVVVAVLLLVGIDAKCKANRKERARLEAEALRKQRMANRRNNARRDTPDVFGG